MFMNSTETIGILIGTATTYTTGSLFLTLFLVMLGLLAVAFMLQIPLEWSGIIILPLLLSYMAYYGEFISIGLVILIYLAIIFTRKFFLR